MSITENPVPTIDISTFLDGSDLVTAPREVKDAAETSGFFQIVGHGIPVELFDEGYRAGDELFNLPDDVQKSLGAATGHPHRGLRTAFDKTTGKRVSGGYTVGRFDSPDDALANGVEERYADHYAPNVWPDLPGFREAFDPLRDATRALGAKVMRIYAVALDLPIDYFDAPFEHDSSTSTIRSYPARHAPLEQDPTVIFDEHFDGGMLTLLHQRGTYDGLQIRDTQGEWFTVPTDDSAFVINIGRLMNRWTNGRWPATRHRVIASADPEAYRYTLPTFYTASAGTLVDPLPTQIGAEGALFEPVTVYDDYRDFLVGTYKELSHTRYNKETQDFVERLATAPK